MRHDLRGYESEREALRANNLRPKLKRLIIVLTTVDTAEQGVGRAEGIEAKGDDYANGAEVMRKMGGQGRLSLQFSSGHIIPISATKETRYTVRCSEFFLSLRESVARWDLNLMSYALRARSALHSVFCTHIV